MPDRSPHPDLEARAADASLGKLRTLRVYAQRDLSLASLADTARRYSATRSASPRVLRGGVSARPNCCRASIVALARGC